ncbi:hypothetical protein [Rhizobium leguminosarum]|nr:hypothetical protein [Rhizobium leguminosarum]
MPTGLTPAQSKSPIFPLWKSTTGSPSSPITLPFHYECARV